MEKWRNLRRGFAVLGVVALFSSCLPLIQVKAADETKQEVDSLNQDIKSKQGKVKELDSLIDKYSDQIKKQEAQQTNLENEILILDNRISKTELDIERAKTLMESLNLEIVSLDRQIQAKSEDIDHKKEISADIIREINAAQRTPILEVLLSKPSLSAFFDKLEQTQRLENKLEEALEQLKNEKIALEQAKKDRDDKRSQVDTQKKALAKSRMDLESEKNFKLSLAAETKDKQSEYERIIYELQQQQQSTADEISNLQNTLKDKLDDVDKSLARGDVLLNWPLAKVTAVTARFHDPTYPFRNRFQHPGIDLRAAVGTPIYAAAGGYVAWNKTGKSYGNYTMIVHPGNIATIYAHQSKFAAKPDTYIRRGDLIGYSGGMPGQPGAGLSTGPHLHFEVRQNGIPVNPENFLPELDLPEDSSGGSS